MGGVGTLQILVLFIVAGSSYFFFVNVEIGDDLDISQFPLITEDLETNWRRAGLETVNTAKIFAPCLIFFSRRANMVHLHFGRIYSCGI